MTSSLNCETQFTRRWIGTGGASHSVHARRARSRRTWSPGRPAKIFTWSWATLIHSSQFFSGTVTNDGGHWRRLSEPPPHHCVFLILVHEHHHPDSNLAIVANEWGAVDPSTSARVVIANVIGPGDPADFGGDATSGGERLSEFVADAGGASDPVQEVGLEDTWDSERW